SGCDRCATSDKLNRPCGRRLSQLFDAGRNSFLRQTSWHVDVQHGLPRSAVDRDGLRPRAGATAAATAPAPRRHHADPERRILQRSSTARQATPATRTVLLSPSRTGIIAIFELEHASRLNTLLA